nr:MAG TPA: hypothetical protein [Caudoviricetes sp.]
MAVDFQMNFLSIPPLRFGRGVFLFIYLEIGDKKEICI